MLFTFPTKFNHISIFDRQFKLKLGSNVLEIVTSASQWDEKFITGHRITGITQLATESRWKVFHKQLIVALNIKMDSRKDKKWFQSLN